jgi:hypothetical protein
MLLADGAGWTCKRGDEGWPPKASRHHYPLHCREVMEALWGTSEYAGYRLWGACLHNNPGRYGFRHHANRKLAGTVNGVRAVNAAIQRMIAS